MLSVTLIITAASTVIFAEDAGYAVKEKIPQQKEPVLSAAAMMFDLLPGGGHFYTGHYYTGAAFGILKGGAAGAAWYSYTLWQDAEKNYRGADRIRKASGLERSDLLPGPDGRMRSVDDYKKDYDRRAQYFTFALIGNLAVYAASWITVWHWCDIANDKALPAFDVGFSMDAAGAGGAVTVCAVQRF